MNLPRIETDNVFKEEGKVLRILRKLKGLANVLPCQSILITAMVLKELKDSSEVENIITTKGELYIARLSLL